MFNQYLADPYIHAIAASGTGDRGLTVLKVIGVIIGFCVAVMVLAIIAALIRFVAPFVMVGSAIAALVGYIMGMYVICLAAGIAFGVCAVGWIIYALMSGE
jgi:hypothetical protein